MHLTKRLVIVCGTRSMLNNGDCLAKSPSGNKSIMWSPHKSATSGQTMSCPARTSNMLPWACHPNSMPMTETCMVYTASCLRNWTYVRGRHTILYVKSVCLHLTLLVSRSKRSDTFAVSETRLRPTLSSPQQPITSISVLRSTIGLMLQYCH